ncbi:CD276 antigen-like [Megalops cyprinoides]|uniref:CD276 antigen-like n=1 Tax=Megalops cyprinoides TaxID=118141 RepID=UPI0018650B11|nr:CD276 antigen-like [Megalops cyprinoides]
MAGPRLAVTIVLLWILTLTECQDTPVTCLFSEACVLPCSFKRSRNEDSNEEVIYWHKVVGQGVTVHCYHGADQLEDQDGRYKGRTSLFKDLISHGNASLLLQNTSIQDQGRYSCQTLNQRSFVNVTVEAPIKSVSMERTREGVACMSQGIYPTPRVSWSTDPPTPSGTLQDSSQLTADAQGLFSVSSTVRMLGNLYGHAYICSVSKEDGSGEWRASFRQQEDIHGEVGQTLAIPCPAPKPSLQNFTQTWTFMGQTPPILTHNSGTSHRHISDLWKNRVQDLLENGSLLIQNPEGQNLTGTYTCKVLADRTLQLVQTYVRFTGADKHSGRFRHSGEEIIQWQTLAGRDVITVHSYYHGNDQLEDQDRRYKGRTSLFKDLISHGNASLLLQSTSIQDQGRYSCQTLNQRSFVNVTVEGDIHGEVGQTLAIPCPAPKPSLQNFTQTWTFMGQTPPILTHNSCTSHRHISDLWKNRVQDLLENGSLLIQNPEGQNLTGTYTCKVLADRTLQLVQTYVMAEEKEENIEEWSFSLWGEENKGVKDHLLDVANP